MVNLSWKETRALIWKIQNLIQVYIMSQKTFCKDYLVYILGTVGHFLSLHYLHLPSWLKSTQRQYISEWTWLCSFTWTWTWQLPLQKQEAGRTWPMGLNSRPLVLILSYLLEKTPENLPVYFKWSISAKITGLLFELQFS